MSNAGSGMCELTNQSRRGIQEGKTELKQSISHRGGILCCSTGQNEETNALKHVNLF